MDKAGKYRQRRKATRPLLPIGGRRGLRRGGEDRVMLVGDADMMDSELETAADGTADIAALRAQRDEYLELAKRERADFDNYRKRIEREMGQIKRESLAGFLKNFFDPLADLDRALAESDRTKSFEALLTGVRMMRDNFRQTLEKAGVRKIEAEGKPFDPALHEAVTMIPSADKPPNTVVEVFDNGYVMDDFVLHPAKVAVSRSPDTA